MTTVMKLHEENKIMSSLGRLALLREVADESGVYTVIFYYTPSQIINFICTMEHKKETFYGHEENKMRKKKKNPQ